MDKQQVINALRRDLMDVIAERKAAHNDAATLAARTALRRFQAERMQQTHADLVAGTETGDAARFFLSDLYNPDNITQRDANVEKLLPSMEKLLPVSALATLGTAVALDALSERLDAAMAARLGADFGEADYAATYRTVTARVDRERQLDDIGLVGQALCDLVRVPLIGKTLTLMRAPARLAGLGEIQGFLERGYRAFSKMDRPEDFVATVLRRERAIMQQLFSGAAHPFELDAAQR